MAYNKITRKETIRVLLISAIVLLIFLLGTFLFLYFFTNKASTYLIKNSYYGFSLTTPKNWIAEGKTAYTESNIAQLIAECKNGEIGISGNEIGRFIFESQKYPKNISLAAYSLAGLSDGAILDVSINCIPDNKKAGLADYIYGGVKIDGEKAFEAFSDLQGTGKTEYVSFFHNGLQYVINGRSYASNAQEQESYMEAINKIISSFKFVN